MNLEVVPDDLQSIVDLSSRGDPPNPVICRVNSLRFSSTSAPSVLIASNIASVSSANSTPDNRLVPSANAAHSNARLVWLLEPGTFTEPMVEEPKGVITALLLMQALEWSVCSLDLPERRGIVELLLSLRLAPIRLECLRLSEQLRYLRRSHRSRLRAW